MTEREKDLEEALREALTDIDAALDFGYLVGYTEELLTERANAIHAVLAAADRAVRP
jgi:hypothetical protein